MAPARGRSEHHPWLEKLERVMIYGMHQSVRIAVYVQPRAKRTEIAGRHGSDIKIRVAAPPIDQAANEALLAFIVQRLGVRHRDVRLIGGATSRRKVLEIDGMASEQIQALLA
jgi:uncharacterized protein (TIGR00251 family)